MFGIGKSRVLAEGAQAEGVVIESRAPADTGEGGIGRMYRLTARVRFDDGTTTEVSSRRLDRTKVGWKLAGDIVPVRYDPADRSKIEIDVPALTAAREREAAELHDSAIAAGEEDLTRRAET